MPSSRMRLRSPGAGVAAAAIVAASVLACAPVMRSTVAGPPSRHLMAQLWNPPEDLAQRDLLDGVGGRREAPDPNVTYTLVKHINHGGSPKIEVRDPSGLKWDVKMGPEAQPEVVASRIVWAVGYHEPLDYYLPVWTLDDHGSRQAAPPARFRPKPHWIKKEGAWSWHSNPFIDTQAFRGLVVLMAILNSSDLKDDNNAVYELKEPIDHATRWYTVKDLGSSLGETSARTMERWDADAFAQAGFVTGVRDGRVFFDYKGRHQEVFSIVRPGDVRWMCALLNRLSDRQWHDAFRAGGYNDDQIAKYVRKMHEKIAQGLSLQGGV